MIKVLEGQSSFTLSDRKENPYAEKIREVIYEVMTDTGKGKFAGSFDISGLQEKFKHEDLLIVEKDNALQYEWEKREDPFDTRSHGQCTISCEAPLHF